MRLGLAQASYKWVSEPACRIDRPEYGFRGMPYAYGTTTVGPIGSDRHVDWWIERCVAWEFEALYIATGFFADDEEVVATGHRLSDLGIEFIGGVVGTWAVDGNEWPDVRAWAIQQLDGFQRAGARMCTLVNVDPPGPSGQPLPNGGLRYGHFSREIPILQQIDRMKLNLGDLAAQAGARGIVLAFENHMDYRLAEIVQVVEAVGSPWLRINYDFANSFAVVEDQVEGARLAAPYTVMTHLKDMRVQSITTTGEPQFLHAPIGHGNVEIQEILGILQENAPNPGSLPHCVETPCLPQYDPEMWMHLNIDWIEAHCAEYFPRRFPPKSEIGAA